MSALGLVVPLKKISKEDTAVVGGKAANLGEMMSAGFRVPDGCAVSVSSYDLFLTKNGLDEKIYDILKTLNVEDSAQLEASASKIQKLILKTDVPPEIKHEISLGYKSLTRGFKKPMVAVRSSATAEDMPGTSFAGQQVTLLNIKGENNVVHAVRECWASLFTPRSIFYRVQNKIPHKKVKIAVIIQKMIESQASGIIFTVDPVTNDKERIIVDAVWGLGELIVQGSVVPDHYVVQKGTFDILSKQVSDQTIMLTRTPSGTREVEVKQKFVGKQKITDSDILSLAKQADLLQKHYYFPQDIEWAKSKDGLFIIQTRPITTLDSKRKDANHSGMDISSKAPILTGIPASPGMATGKVIILKGPNEISKVKTGDVMVTKMTSPDYVPAMKKAAAIVTDEGGMTSHAAIVSRELGTPCIVGTKTATTVLKAGEIVTVDAKSGVVFIGSKSSANGNLSQKTKKDDPQQKHKKLKTATKLYVNLAEPERAKDVAGASVDGVGLLRAEFMMANIGIHPKEAIRLKKQKEYIDRLAEGIKVFCKNFYPRYVTYRASDFKTNEYRSLEGGKKFEPEEPNPLLGFRGAFRYIANQEVFTLELKALLKVMHEYNNIALMIPFVRSPKELAMVRKIVDTQGLFNFPSFKFLMMVELPVNVISLEDFIKVGIDGVSIGSNDLTMLVTGTDRDNSSVSQAFDERSDAVLWALKRTIKICNKYNKTSSICGQAPSLYDDFVEKLVSWGVSAISVNPDAIERVREVIYEAERKLVKA